MDTPQEVEVWFILPAIRRQYVLALKKKGLKQKEIASLMSITEPAVSQYLKGKRGDAINFSKEIIAEIERSALKVTEENYKKKFQKILKRIKKSRFICSVCHKHTDSDDSCEICF